MKTKLWLLFGLGTSALVVLVGAVIIQQQSGVVLSGQLNAQVGQNKVDDGYYDMRIVAYDSKTGEALKINDFADVNVGDGVYKVNLDIPKNLSTGTLYYQLCRSNAPSTTPDGFVSTNLPVRCDADQNQGSALSVVECPKKLVIESSGVLGSTSSYATPNCIDEQSEPVPASFSVSNTERTAVASVFGERGPIGPAGPKGDKGDTGDTGTAGSKGNPGDPASDDQTLSFGGASVLSISGGNSLSLAALLDNTDTLASLSCSSGQVSQWNGSAWVCASPAVSSDSQTLALAANTLSILNGNSVSLAGYLDNTDSQSITLASNIISISGNASTINLAPYLDNTDAQALSLSTNTLSLVGGGSVNLAGYLDNTDSQDLALSGTTLSLTGDGTSVSLASFLDNTDVLAGLSCANSQVAKWNGSAWVCANDTDTVLNESQVDAYVANNGYLTTEVDGSTTNELQNLTFASNVLGLTSSGTTFDLSAYLDNTDSQDMSLSGNTLSLTGDGTSVSLATYLDNTDAQSISVASHVLSISGNASTVSLAPYLDNTDSQTLSYVAGTQALSIGGGNSVSLSTLLDNTDSQTLSLVTNTLSIAGGNSVSLASYLDNTDAQDLSIASDILSLTGDGTTVSLTPYLDNTDSQSISLSSNVLSISGNASTVNLASYLDNTDSQAISIAANVISIAGNASTIDLSSYLDNTDSQDLSLSANTLSLSGDGTTVSLASYLDNTDVLAGLSCSNGQVAQWNGSAWVCANAATDTDTQDLSLSANTLSLVDGGSVSLASYLDNTDAQSLSISSDIISISGNASTIDLSPYLDNTDSQTLSLSVNTLSLVSGGSVNLAGYLDNTDSQDLSLSANTLSLTGDGTTVNLAAYLDNTDVLAGLSCSSNQIPKWNGSAWACATDVDTVLNEAQVDAYIANNGYLTTEVDGSTSNELQDLTFAANVLGLTSSGTSFDLSSYLDNTDAQDMSLSGNTLSLTGDGTSVSLASYLDNTDSQSISLSSNIISISGNASTVDLSAYLDDTDTQDLSLAGNTLSLIAGGSVDLSGYLDNTDSQDLVLTGNTLSLTSDGTTVSLASYLDNTDSQNLFFTINTDTGTDPSADSTTDPLNIVSGSGVTVTGDSSTDTLTFEAVLGTDITSAEIVDNTIIDDDIASGTITGAKIAGTTITGSNIANATIANSNLVNSSVSVTAGTGLSGGGTVSLGGTVTLNLANDFGAGIDSAEITNGTIAFADISQNSCNTNDIIKWNGSAWACASDATGGTVNSFETIATTSGTSPVADSSTDTLTLSAGSGVTVTGNSSTDTITLAAVLGTDITSAEIVDNTIIDDDIASGTITGAKIAGTTITGSNIASSTVANSNLVNNSLTVTAGTGLSGGGAVALGGTVTLNLANDFGASIDSGEITNGTIAAIDVAGNVFVELGRSSAQTDTTTNSTIFVNKSGASGNLVQLQAATVDEFVIGFDGTIDTASVDSTSIINGSVANVDLANSSVTVTAGSGLVNGGAINLGGSATINIGAGNGITVNADDISVNVATSADGLSATTSSGSGLEVLASGVSLLQGCANNEILKWNETADVWACAADAGLTSEVDGVVGNEVADATASGGLTRSGSGTGGSPYTLGIGSGAVTNTMLVNSGLTVTAGAGLTTGGSVSLGGTVTLDVGAGTAITVNGNDIAVTANGVNYTELADSLSLDATTTTALGANNLITNIDSTGTVQYQDVGVTFLTIDATGGYSYTLDATDNPTYTITNAGTGNVLTNLSGSGDFVVQDNGTPAFVVQDNGGVYIGDPSSAIATGSLLVLDSITTDPTGTAGSMYYNSTLAKFRCFQAGLWRDCISPTFADRRVGTLRQITTGAAVFTAVNITIPTNTGTVANAIGTESNYISFTTAAGAGSTAGAQSTAFTDTRRNFLPVMKTRIKTGSSIASSRFWTAMTSASILGTAPVTTAAALASPQYAGVAYDATVNAGNFICGSGDGANHSGVDMGIAVAASTYYDIIIDMSVAGTISCSVSTSGGSYTTVSKSTNLPAAATGLGVATIVSNAAGGGARALSTSYILLEQN